MVKRTRTVVSYQCGVCKTSYGSRRRAARCERRALEKRTFSVQSRVRNIEPRFCGMSQKSYRFRGRIVKIAGPKASDFEYEVKWLGGKEERLNGHVFQYEVAFRCPHCKEKRKELYYAPELRSA